MRPVTITLPGLNHPGYETGPTNRTDLRSGATWIQEANRTVHLTDGPLTGRTLALPQSRLDHPTPDTDQTCDPRLVAQILDAETQLNLTLGEPATPHPDHPQLAAHLYLVVNHRLGTTVAQPALHLTTPRDPHLAGLLSVATTTRAPDHVLSTRTNIHHHWHLTGANLPTLAATLATYRGADQWLPAHRHTLGQVRAALHAELDVTVAMMSGHLTLNLRITGAQPEDLHLLTREPRLQNPRHAGEVWQCHLGGNIANAPRHLAYTLASAARHSHLLDSLPPIVDLPTLHAANRPTPQRHAEALGELLASRA